MSFNGPCGGTYRGACDVCDLCGGRPGAQEGGWFLCLRSRSVSPSWRGLQPGRECAPPPLISVTFASRICIVVLKHLYLFTVFLAADCRRERTRDCLWPPPSTQHQAPSTERGRLSINTYQKNKGQKI